MNFITSALIATGLIATAAAAATTAPATQPTGGAHLDSILQDSGVPAIIDPRVRRYIVPSRIVWTSPDDQGSVKDAENLLKAGTGQVTLSNHVACTLTNRGKTAGILLDFGRELQGGVKIYVSGSKANHAVHLRVRFGESATEAMSELGGPTDATNDHAIRDQTTLVPWLGTAEIGNTAFRFVRIDLADPDSFVSLESVRAVLIYRDLPYLGSFRCNDERLNKIWETGAYTVHLNMQDYLWDGAKRDRLVWIGDMHPETQTIAAVFGRQAIVPASLDVIRNETPLPGWMNGISSYSIWWILIQRDLYRQTGDLDYLRAQQPYLKKLLSELARNIGPDGSETLPEMRFLDWPSSENKPAIHAGLQSLMVLAFEAGAQLASPLEDQELRSQCDETLKNLRRHVPAHGNSKQAAALMVLAGLGDARELNQTVMAVDGAKRMSTFYGYYVLQARAKAGDDQGCLDAIRTFWGGMLDLGATTFWEDFNLDWTPGAARIDELTPQGMKDIHGDYGAYCYKGFRHSLCHGWASGPTPWLSEHVLGIQIVEPGFKAVRIEPHLGDLQWAEGTFPTPLGIIRVRHEKAADGKVTSKIDSPPGMRVVTSAP